jgi:hypothetical protein
MLVHLLILGHVFSEQARTSSKLEIPTVDALATETMLRISDFWDYISIRDPNLYANNETNIHDHSKPDQRYLS